MANIRPRMLSRIGRSKSKPSGSFWASQVFSLCWEELGPALETPAKSSCECSQCSAAAAPGTAMRNEPQPADQQQANPLLTEATLLESCSFPACNSSCLRQFYRSIMSGAKSLREFVLTMPSLSVYANVGFNVKEIKHETKFVTLGNGSKRPIAIIHLACDPQYTEVLKSLAEIQEKLGDAIFAEVRVTTAAAKPGLTRLDVFCGRVDLAGQLRSNLIEDDTMAPVVLKIRLPHLISGDCDPVRVNAVFNYLSSSVISEMIKKTFEDE